MATFKLPSQDELKNRFWELKPKRDALRAKADPVRAERDKLVAKHRKEEDAANAKVRAAEKGLAEMDLELAQLTRFVAGGKMGEPEA